MQNVTLSFLLQFRPDKNKKNQDLLEAAKVGDTDKVIKLLAKGADVEARDDDGWTPLHWACRQGNVEVFEALLAKGADVNARNDFEQTPLHWARGNLDVTEMLLSIGADVGSRNKRGETPLHDACVWGTVEAVEALLLWGANPDARNGDGQTPLHNACVRGSVEVVEALITYGGNVGATDNSGRTPLDLAQVNGWKAIVRLLTSCLSRSDSDHIKESIQKIPSSNADSAEVSIRAASQELFQAVTEGNKDKVLTLLAKGADVEARNTLRGTPLHSACYHGNVELVEALLSKGANIEASDLYGGTPLHDACKKGKVEVVETLLANGANIEARDNYGSIPLHHACKRGDAQVVEALLAKGTDVQAQDNERRTPLHWACCGEDIAVVEVLLAKGADIKATDFYGLTPLHLACESGNIEVVEALLDKGADIAAIDKTGQTPLDLGDRYSIAMLIETRMARNTSDPMKVSNQNTSSPKANSDESRQMIQTTKSDTPASPSISPSPSSASTEHQIHEESHIKGFQIGEASIQLTNDDILFLRKGQRLLKDVDVIPLISEQEKIAIQTLTANIMDFERSLESLQELPASLAHKGLEISTYFFFFTHAFERMFVAAQAVSTGSVALQLDWRDGTMETLLGGASLVAEKSQLPFLGCISIFSAMIIHQKRTLRANTFIAFADFFRGKSRDQYLLTYRKIAEQICLRLDSSSLVKNDLSKLETYRKRVNEIIEPIKRHLRKVHLLSIEELSCVQARAMLDLSLITKEVLRLHQYEQGIYLELCSSDESVKASYFAEIVCGQSSSLVDESSINSSGQDNGHKPFVIRTSSNSKNPESVKQAENIPISVDEIRRLIKQIDRNNSIALDLQQTQAKLHRLEEEVRGKKEFTVSSGCQAQLSINPHKSREEIQQLKGILHQIESDLSKVHSQQDAIQKKQEKQYQELEKLKLENFINNRILSYSEAYEFTERLLMNACDRDGKPLNIFVGEDGRFELDGKKQHIGVLRKGIWKKSLWKGRVEIKLEGKHKEVESIMDWFDQLELRRIYERNKKQTILLMFKKELDEPYLSDMVKPFHLRNDQDIRDEIFDANLCPNLK